MLITSLVVCATLLLGGCNAQYSTYPPYPPAFGGFANCGAMKVNEVMDQIYCRQGYYTRFTSTALAALKVVIYELGLVDKFIHIDSCQKYIAQAIYILKDLNKEIYQSYDSSRLTKVYENVGPDYDGIKDLLANLTSGIAAHEGIRLGFLKDKNNKVISWGTFIADEDTYADGEVENQDGDRYQQKRSILPRSTARRIRASNSEYEYTSDSTCQYISPSPCSGNSVLVRNVLYNGLKGLKSLNATLTILYDYIQNNGCGRNNSNKYALLVTADAFGSTLTAAEVLLQLTKYLYVVWINMAAPAGNYGNTGRSGGDSYTYSYSYRPFGNYMVPGPYRYSRNTTRMNARPS